MKKELYLIWAVILIGTAPLKSKSIVDERVLEPAIIEILYERRMATDTLQIDTDFRINYLTYCAGKNISVFYDAKYKSYDSLMAKSPEYVKTYLNDMLNGGKMLKEIGETDNETIFINYPAGKVTNHTRHSLCNWIYEEEWRKPIWEITDSTTTIGGYECLLATSNYCGRLWYAWFTPEIPIPGGPWKLSGLPGLILKAHDTKRHYQYSAVQIKLNPGKQIEYFNYISRIKTDRNTSLKNKRKSLQENVKNLILSSGAYGINNSNIKFDKVDKSKPLPHKNYDFEEIDYPHD